jgi:aminoglycoside phosphotransferase (APT) family kinase protein
MTQPQWTRDIEVDASLAARAIGEQFPALRDAPVAPFGSGWDNAAFLVDRRFIFRFPVRRIAAPLIEREIAILPLIAPALPLPIPAATFIGVPSLVFPHAFAGYPLLAGTPSDTLELSEDARAGLAEPLATFLRALHAIPPATIAAATLPGDEIGRLDHEKRLRVTRERVAFLSAEGYADLAPCVDWLAANPPRALAPDACVCVHGDLYARHVLIDDRVSPTGIIDWGDVHIGDPALDLAIAYLMLPAAAHERFRAAYGPIDESASS